jgi:predicted ATPase
VGVSQVIPVVVGSLLQSDSTVVVEQPELHLHPAVQARLGDLFINGALEDANNRFILESHSEHLMLRLLRRIRETTEKDEEYPDYLAELKPEHVSVYYVQSSAGKTEMIPLRITEDGDFKDRWPNGFFDERAEELF